MNRYRYKYTEGSERESRREQSYGCWQMDGPADNVTMNPFLQPNM